ncbi:pirin family protein [Runella salmonicolor]|uniref:Pirin family protein n=1 Tax=Runella salmonicolor TaxID=2950278 RepID=A0ABT1FIZ7_9BACT|nr:pirin family protein [Runella salmonicolor]MCP1381709.1 pirin family protein [Runella salmonicolor]
MTQIEATIFLADQRGCSQTDWFRSFHGFNFGAYHSEHRQPFGRLRVFNDDTLAAQKSLKMQVDENTEVILMPLVGAIEYRDSLGETGFVEAGQVRIFSAARGMEYEITNPYPDELVNFLQIWLTGNEQEFTPSLIQNSFDFQQKNQLLPLLSTQTRAYIGQFGGREEGIYEVQHPNTHGIFVFVIEGAFEVQNRLLHPRDGLALKGVDTVDFEALSNDAILFLLEVPLEPYKA